MESYFLQPDQQATLSLYNGTFEKSENIITRDRMLDASIVAGGKRAAINPEQWKDQDSTLTKLLFETGEPGTYVAGVSTKSRNIELSAAEFNDYLQHDGVLDMLEYRTANDLMGEDAVESYEKHVKAIFQVGEIKTDDWKTVLGYPIEFVPLANPYDKNSGDVLAVKLLLEGKPLVNQLVYGHYVKSTHTHSENEHTHTHDGTTHSHDDSSANDHTHTDGQQLRTNDEGVVMLKLPEDGIYYLRTIHMIDASDNEELTHRSKWATLSFEVSHEHGPSTHSHDHEHESGIPTWLFIVGSVLIIGLIFLYFRKKG